MLDDDKCRENQAGKWMPTGCRACEDTELFLSICSPAPFKSSAEGGERDVG